MGCISHAEINQSIAHTSKEEMQVVPLQSCTVSCLAACLAISRTYDMTGIQHISLPLNLVMMVSAFDCRDTV
jgi:hypothetical protein